MAGTFTITSVAGLGPSYTLTVSSSSGVAADDYIACGILGVTTYDGGIYRVTSVPDASNINIQDDVGSPPYGKPAKGKAQYYTPTAEKKLSQLVTGGYYWSEPQRRDSRIIDEALGIGGGNVSGPASSTDNTVGVFDGTTGKSIKEPDTAVGFAGQDITNVGSVAGHVPTTRAINNGTGIGGGGDLSADRTLSVDQSALDPVNMGSGSATSGQVPTASGGGAITWEDQSGGSGDVTGPSSSTNNRATVFDGTTGKIIKEPNAAVDFNAQNITNVGSVAGHVPATRAINNGTGISGGGDLSADRTLSVNESALDPANMGSGSATVDYVPKADGGGGIDWGPISGSGVGDVSGPASSTNNGVVVFDGTGGKTIKGASAAVDFGAQNITNVGTVAGHVPTTRAINNGTGISGGGDLSADRTLSVNQSALDPANMSSGSATDGYVATADGIGGIAWEEGGGGGGGVSGPGSSTDHALPRWDSTGGDTLLNSGVTLSDADAMVFPTGGSISKPGTGVNSQAFGNGATAGGDRGVAVGYNATAPGNYATIVGGGATGVSGDGATAIGFSCDAGINAVCIGRESEAWEAGSIAIGFRSYVRAPTSGDSWGAIAIGLEADVGNSSNAGSDGAIAVGYNAVVGYSCKDSIGIGYNASVGNGSAECVAIGPSAAITSSADDAVAIGKLASVSASNGIAIGDAASATASRGIAIGLNSKAYSTYSVSIGDGAQNFTGTSTSIAIGQAATNWTNINNAISIGRYSECANSGDFAIAIGDNTAGKHPQAIALGRDAETTGSGRCTIGTIGGSYDQELQFGRGLACWGATPPASQPTKINDIAETADGTYDTTEQNMLNNLKARVNAIIDVLEGAGLSSAT